MSQDNIVIQKIDSRIIVIIIFLILFSSYIFIVYINRNYEETDNAVVKCEIVDIVPEISGIIDNIYFGDNQIVKKDQILLKIKDDVQRSNLEVYQADLKVQYSQIETVKNNIRLAKIEFKHDKKQLRRMELLNDTKSNTIKELDDAKYQIEKQRLKIEILDGELITEMAKMEKFKAKLNEANVYLNQTSLKSLRDGVVANLRVYKGEYMASGQTVASITSCRDKVWIEANYKETQIGRMKSGQEVEVYIDTYPDIVLKGNVESISTGSGSTFSVLPPENASGNFTKVVQRFPVRIELNDANVHKLRLGMSVVVKVLLNQ